MQYEVERKFSANVIFESSVAIGDYSYLLIYGRHINGYYCCIPGWHWGCEMAAPCETGYNQNKLIECGADVDIALTLAKAIFDISENL